jgi:hypothetical protein
LKYLNKTVFKILFFIVVIALMLSPILPDNFLDFMDSLGLNDKGEHFIAFFLLSFLLNRASDTRIHRLRNVLLLFSFGVMIELIQLFIPERGTSLADILANFAGILVFQFCFSLYLFFVKRKKNFND